MLSLGINVKTSEAQAGTAYDLIDAVNALRAANGLPPYQIHSILMSTAQQHSEYQASIGTVTHTGPGGTRPIDRVIAAGFGDGKKVFVSENIAGGLNMSVETAIYTYWQDSLHMSTMLNPNAQYVGAGVAKAGDYVYYTLDVGYITGAPANATVPPGTSQPYATAVPYDPFIKSTPRPDGAIIHVVGYGQTLIGIANTYDVPLQTIYDLNGFNNNTIIYPGEEIIIQLSQTPTITSTEAPSPSQTNTPTNTTTPTAKPTSSKTPGVTPSITIVPSPTPQSIPAPWLSIKEDDLITIVFVLAGIVIIGIFLTLYLERKG